MPNPVKLAGHSSDRPIALARFPGGQAWHLLFLPSVTPKRIARKAQLRFLLYRDELAWSDHPLHRGSR